jgi:hypothetical protein
VCAATLYPQLPISAPESRVVSRPYTQLSRKLVWKSQAHGGATLRVTAEPVMPVA